MAAAAVLAAAVPAATQPAPPPSPSSGSAARAAQRAAEARESQEPSDLTAMPAASVMLAGTGADDDPSSRTRRTHSSSRSNHQAPPFGSRALGYRTP